MRFVHYKWLEAHLPRFLEEVGVTGGWDANAGILGAHGDKARGYRAEWEAAGLHFAFGCAIYLLSHTHPFSAECRNTASGWVDPGDWVIKSMDRFLHLLPPVDESDPRYCVEF